MGDEPWHPGLGDEAPDGWAEGDEPPQYVADAEEDVPDPNMEGMPHIWGYEDCDFDKSELQECVPVPSEEECRQALVAYVESNCCLGKEPINSLVINNIVASNAFKFTLESFVEKRKAGYEFKPYKGGEIDDPSHGRAPETWEMEVKPKELFKKAEVKKEVPHTSSVRTCHVCLGLGYVRCFRCHGWGRHVCRSCSGFVFEGEGMEVEAAGATCQACSDSRYEQCGDCSALGRRVCPACDGYRAIRCFIQLKVKFKNHKEEYLREETDLPDHLVAEVGWITMFEQMHEQLAPIEGFPIPEIDSKSKQFLAKHRLELLDKKRLLQQRQKLSATPVTEVHVTWKDQPGRYWVYGKEQKVYCPDYPEQCACCVIL
ncbi:hypothetical protein BaRGS_00005111 [Batillaria attramentaria]|uniref:Protein SSUH2 homolog n=1 Tax=Batillaria attramentaria TaxID=370345 RepID=A0ABD0LW34_9CAEN